MNRLSCTQCEADFCEFCLLLPRVAVVALNSQPFPRDLNLYSKHWEFTGLLRNIKKKHYSFQNIMKITQTC